MQLLSRAHSSHIGGTHGQGTYCLSLAQSLYLVYYTLLPNRANDLSAYPLTAFIFCRLGACVRVQRGVPTTTSFLHLAGAMTCTMSMRGRRYIVRVCQDISHQRSRQSSEESSLGLWPGYVQSVKCAAPTPVVLPRLIHPSARSGAGDLSWYPQTAFIFWRLGSSSGSISCLLLPACYTTTRRRCSFIVI